MSLSGLGRRRDEQTAILEEVPDRSQVDGPICVLSSECRDVASSQEIMEIRAQRLSRHYALRSHRPIRHGEQSYHLSLNFGASTGRPHYFLHETEAGMSYWCIGDIPTRIAFRSKPTVIRLSTVSFTATIPARDEPHQQTVSGVIGIDVGHALVRLQEAA